ncbi:hypothetical protein HZH68_012222 [Vespula germanica]|uniref:Uncharacterized protein n=1 Tax=Vespula germanica TaxID=30212 RepID=A0A834MXL9_VESGE|nr:hypothetical protein HZH68_012222 [Vespula germanica]
MAPNRFSLGPDRLASDRLPRTAKSSDFCTIVNTGWYVHSDTRLCMATTTFGIVEAAAAIAAERTHAVDDRVDDGVAREIVCSSKSVDCIMHYGGPLCQDTGSMHGALPENGVGTIHTRTGLNYTPLWL